MTKLIDYLLENETIVVFDVDGVLAPYEFGDLCHTIAPDEEWERIAHEGDPYSLVNPVRLLQDFIAEKGTDRVFSCSVACDYEIPSKLRFVAEGYGIPEDHACFVAAKPDKTEFLLSLAERFGVSQERVAMVEDTVKTLDALVRDGYAFTTVHVSSMFAYAE